MKTPEVVQTEIGKLIELKPKIRATTFFGDNNRDAIQAQIDVLTDLMDEDDIYDMGSDDDDEPGEWTQHEIDSALEAHHWLYEETDEAPSVGWEPLIQ